MPPPKVESAVLNLDVKTDTGLTNDERSRMFELATMAFQRKRKTIANGLAQGLDRPKSEIEFELGNAGIDPMRRPQTLDVSDWVELSQAVAP
jgi:16S rRNA (adenine1518-N6/adenine1519-N6)-dimethyltransferase